jgi:hypothetical protein
VEGPTPPLTRHVWGGQHGGFQIWVSPPPIETPLRHCPHIAAHRSIVGVGPYHTKLNFNKVTIAQRKERVFVNDGIEVRFLLVTILTKTIAQIMTVSNSCTPTKKSKIKIYGDVVNRGCWFVRNGFYTMKCSKKRTGLTPTKS